LKGAIKPGIVPQGRLDTLAFELLRAGVRQHGNPVFRVGLKLCETELAQALLETLGPATPAGMASARFLEAAREFEAKLAAARAAVQLEDQSS
jgi:hypothetical protein